MHDRVALRAVSGDEVGDVRYGHRWRLKLYHADVKAET
jgi:hypothetical protein